MRLRSFLVFLTKSVFSILPLLAFILLQNEAAASTPLVLYNFNAGSGEKVYDVSGNGTPMDLKIRDAGNIHWIQGGGLAVDRPTLIAANGLAHKITDAIKASNAFTIETWIRPASKKQNGPARIVTLSRDRRKRNLTLGQDNDSYDMRIRTTRTDDNGMPSLHGEKGALSTNLTHVVYTRNSKGIGRLYVNGILQSRKRDQGDLGSWDSNYGFALANELTGDRPWTGSYYQVAIYSEALSEKIINQSFTAGLSTTDSGDSNSTIASRAATDSQAKISSGSTNTTGSSTSLINGSVSLSWNAPVTRNSGEALAMNEIAGYTVYYGKTAGIYPNSISINDAYITATTITELPIGTYYFVVTALDTNGNESAYSNIERRRTL